MSTVDIVTGATGHLGNVLVRHLLERGRAVRAVVQPRDDLAALAGLAVERAEADVTDAAALERAFAGGEVVFHLAGLVSITAGQEARLRAVNVEGTRNVVAACRRAGVRRLVYASSVHALEEPRGGALSEAAGFGHPRGAYGRSKAEASRLVEDAARAGQLDAVLVLPTGVVGPWDFRLSEVGQLIASVGEGRMPVAVGGGYDWVDVRDVAKGLALAAERGRCGESYLVNGEWVSMREVFTHAARAAQVAPPRATVPLALLWPVAAFGPVWERVTRRRALVTPYALHQLGVRHRVDDGKARRELGYTSRPIAESVADAWRFLADHPSSPLRRHTVVGPGRVMSPVEHPLS